MHKMKKVISLLCFLHGFTLLAQTKILPAQAESHIGDSVSVSGIIYGGHEFKNPGHRQTVLLLGDTLFSKPLLLFIPGSSQANFHDSLAWLYFNKPVTVEGRLSLFMGLPAITLFQPEQLAITLQKGTNTKDSNATVNVPPSLNLDTYDGCAPVGQTTNPVLEALNRQKNRYNVPSDTDVNQSVTLASLLAPGDDENRWNVRTAVEITGYVFEVKPGGSETCNCHVNDDVHTDTHIVLLADPKSTAGSKRMIVEITPRMRFLMAKQGIDWSTAKLKSQLTGHWIKIRGWLFFDLEHQASAENTNPGNAKNWRATAWEVHPITSLEVVNH